MSWNDVLSKFHAEATARGWSVLCEPELFVKQHRYEAIVNVKVFTGRGYEMEAMIAYSDWCDLSWHLDYRYSS